MWGEDAESHGLQRATKLSVSKRELKGKMTEV